MSSEEGGPLNPARRRALKEIGALVGGAVGALALPNLAGATSVAEREFLSDLGVVSKEMRSPRIRANLASGSGEMIRRILAENRISLPPIGILQNSSLNPEQLFRYPLLLGSTESHSPEEPRHLSLVGAGDATTQVNDLANAVNGSVAHGNATPIAPKTVITAGHLDSALARVPEVTMLSAANTDLAVAVVAGQNFSPEQMVALPTNIRDSDVHGQFVVIPGIDPDATAMRRGMYKVYDGLAFQITPAMVRDLFPVTGNDPQSVRMWQWAHHSLCLLIPEGESSFHRSDERYPRAAGMSGSPVFMLRNGGEYIFVGVFWGVSSFTYAGKTYSVGLFLGPDTINRETAYMMPPSQAPSRR